jgi:hypothetical protein
VVSDEPTGKNRVDSGFFVLVLVIFLVLGAGFPPGENDERERERERSREGAAPLALSNLYFVVSP